MRGDEFFEEIASRPPLTKLHPCVASFLKSYLEGEKVVPFGGQRVINTQFPPYPGRAFESLLDHFLADDARRLYSVTLAVTNRCRFRCWHCYNAGRSQEDLPLEVFRSLAAELQGRGAVVVTLTGGEPLLRQDLEEICIAFDERSCLIVGTTGEGLTVQRARRLRDCGVFAVGISLDSADPTEHNERRGRKDAYRIALDALASAGAAGLYPYVVSVGTREFLERKRFFDFLRHAREAGALEVHLLEPCPTGRIAGRSDVVLTPSERRRIVGYQREVARREDLPILSTFAYLEGKSDEPKKWIRIELRLTGNLPHIRADASQIEQILINLSVNARDAMPEQGTLAIETAKVTLDDSDLRNQPEVSPGNYALLSVSDTGHGMDVATREHIFDPFFTTKEVGKGTGLGLAMVYGIVRNHGGHVTCESSPREGTTFRIYLPAMEAPMETHQAGEVDNERVRGDETILLVDDDDALRELGGRILERFGYTVIGAEDGETALNLYREKRDVIELVILDLIMPGMGGKHCLHELLKMDPLVKVLIASGHSDTTQIARIAEIGAKAHVRKPYDVEQLLKVVREIL